LAGHPDEEKLLPDRVRQPREVAVRALCLFAAVAAALGAPRDQIVPWLHEHRLWSDLSPAESAFLLAQAEDPKSRINFGWQSERLLALLWALGKIEELPGSDIQCDTAEFQSILPPFADLSVAEFLSRATLRPEEALIDRANKLLDEHWQARDAGLNGEKMPVGIDIEIVQERHHAINWVIGYGALPWDEVTTDT
jgi:hypothetical protein